MEFISTNQLQKYEGIINQIKCELGKYNTLKEDVEKEKDNVILSQLSKSTLIQRLCHLNIQVFNMLTDVINLYGEELYYNFPYLLKYGNCKFYLIEIYITKTLLQKAIALRCFLHICVKMENSSVNKTKVLSNKMPIREIIPVENNIINSTVEVSLVVPSESESIIIKLETTSVDISYHFQVYKEKFKRENKLKNIMRITENYNKNFSQNLQTSPTLERKLFCNVENSEFVTIAVKNCYHSLDMELFLELNNEVEKDFVLKLTNGIDNFNITFNKREKYLKIEGSSYILCLLKKYFSKEFYKKIEINKYLVSDAVNILKTNEKSVNSPQQTCAFFCEVRNSWSKLPI